MDGSDPDNALRLVLRRRDLGVWRCNPGAGVLVEPASDRVDLFYELLKRYSFRLFLRDAIRLRERLEPARLDHYVSARRAAAYLALLVKVGAIEEAEGGLRLARPEVRDYGDTFEWYVAEVFRRELGSPAWWGVEVDGVRRGGDFDVLALVEGRLAFVSTKSGPPKHIDARDASAFFDHVDDLRPDLALFVEDTHLRMRDKLVGLLEDEARRRHGARAPRPARLREEVFAFGDRLFLLTTYRDLVRNLVTCLRHALTRPWP